MGQYGFLDKCKMFETVPLESGQLAAMSMETSEIEIIIQFYGDWFYTHKLSAFYNVFQFKGIKSYMLEQTYIIDLVYVTIS